MKMNNRLRNNIDKIDWQLLTINPNVGDLIYENIDKINWFWISENPCIFDLNYKIYNRMNIIKEELIQKVLHPEKN